MTLGTWPTPIRRLPDASARAGVEVFVKVESESGAWGGNKVRKLEYALPHLRDRAVCTHGAGTSSWASALAYHAAPVAREVHLGLAGRVPDDLATLYTALGTRLHTSPYLNALPLTIVRARIAAGRGAVTLATGGSGLPGDFGSTWAGVEIGDAVANGEIPTPAEVVVACGSAGTAAGLAAGLGLAGLPTKVVAVRVAPRPFGSAAFARRRARRVLGAIAAHAGSGGGHQAVELVGEERFFGPGYGKPTAASSSAIEVGRGDGINLDPIYAAKAFAALLARAPASGGPMLFVHTSPGPAPAAVEPGRV